VSVNRLVVEAEAGHGCLQAPHIGDFLTPDSVFACPSFCFGSLAALLFCSFFGLLPPAVFLIAHVMLNHAPHHVDDAANILCCRRYTAQDERRRADGPGKTSWYVHDVPLPRA